jgi:RimJ/RimL family protein N-acetyltransferase
MVEANIDYEKIEGLQKGDANISYGLYPEARGKGYATRAVNMITEFLRQKGVERVVLRINPDNPNSLKIPVNCGFQSAGEIMTKEGKMLMFSKKLK